MEQRDSVSTEKHTTTEPGKDPKSLRWEGLDDKISKLPVLKSKTDAHPEQQIINGLYIDFGKTRSNFQPESELEGNKNTERQRILNSHTDRASLLFNSEMKDVPSII